MARVVAYRVEKSQFERKYNAICKLFELVLNSHVFEALEVESEYFGQLFDSHSGNRNHPPGC